MTLSPAAQRRPASWHTATVVEAVPETSSARRLTFDVPTWPGNEAGSHVDVRLTAPDGYQASRSYSIASSGEGTQVVLAVDEVPDGEVSPFLVQDLQVGDQLELHGPLGAYFIWQPGDPRPVQLIAGGSGVVPLYAIAAAHARARDESPFRLLYSVRTPDDVFFRRELADLAGTPDSAGTTGIDYVYTRRAPTGWPGVTGRVTRERLDAAVWPAASDPLVYVCGPTAFVETIADWLTAAGHPGSSIRTERFGGT